MNDQNPELDGAGGGAEDTELELEVTPEGDKPKEPSGDPLDDIQDPVARAEAKKYRAIARRNEKPEGETKVDTPAPALPTTEFLTKADFYKSNERKAIREITADAELKAVWNEIIPFYTPRRGKETPEDIKDDILDAITLYKARNPAVVTDDSKDVLTTSSVVKTGGGPVDKVAAQKPEPPNFRLPKQPSDWYKTKS